MLPQPRDELERAVAIVNTWDTLEPNPELMRDVEVLRRFLRWIGHADAGSRVREADVERFRLLRTRLRRAFEARNERVAVRELNAILAESNASPRLERDGSDWRFRYGPPPSEGIDFLAPTSAIALLEAIKDGGWERFGVCAGAPCSCVYVDRSRNRRRRYCSDLCNDRMAQAAARKRRTGGPS